MMIGATDERVPFELPAIAARACAFQWQPNEDLWGISCGASGWLEARSRLVDVSSARERPDDIVIDLPDRLAKAVNKRKAEFLAGQLCATLALEQLSGAVLPLPRRADRSPQWPEGHVGSISHTDSRAIAIAAQTSDYRLLGIDLEKLIDAPRAEAVGPLVASPADWNLRPAAMAREAFLTVIFSAKEALYKAIFPVLGRMIEFSDVTLRAFGDDWLELVLSPEIRAGAIDQERFRLRYRLFDGHCLSILAVRPA